MRALAFGLAIALFGGWLPSAPARADDVPTVTALRAKALAATGGDKQSPGEREAWDIVEGDLHGTLRRWIRGDDYLSVATLGQFVTEGGTWAGRDWQQDENGYTVIERPDQQPIDRVVAESVARVSQPVDAFVLRTKFASGNERREFYDRRTFLLVRIERTYAGGQTFTNLDDYRAGPSGEQFAWHTWGGTGNPIDAWDYRLRSDDAGVIPDADIAIPADRRTVVEFPAGAASVRLPATIGVGGKIVVRGTIAGRGLDLLLDSGTSSVVLDEGVLQRLGIPTTGRNSGPGGKLTTGLAVVPELDVGALRLHNLVVHTQSLGIDLSPEVKVVGLLGFDFIAGAAFRIDYGKGTVDAFPAAGFAVSGAHEVPVRLNGRVPFVTLTVAGTPGDRFLLDTGSDAAFVLFQHFLNQRIPPRDARKIVQGDTRIHRTVYGLTIMREAKVDTLALGDVSLGTQGLVASDPDAFAENYEDGLVGWGSLRNFILYLDYARQRILLADPPKRS